MATIQFRRQLKFAHPKKEALEYIKTKLTLAAGEPLLCTYKNPNGKWGSMQIICVYPRDTQRSNTILSGDEYNAYFTADGKLNCNLIKILDGEWESI